MSDNEYMRQYMSSRYKRRKQQAIQQLGGQCVRCGSTSSLHFDHIDPSSKLFTIGKELDSCSEKRLQEELAKCQLLCLDCYKIKSKEEGSQGSQDRNYTCSCGKSYTTTKSWAGHKTWCKQAPVA